jgi:hypothetical protein
MIRPFGRVHARILDDNHDVRIESETAIFDVNVYAFLENHCFQSMST